MDDETVFGPVIHQLTFGQAIQDELLNDYQVVIVGVDEPMIKQWIDNYEIVATNPDEITDARTLAAKIGILKAVKDHDLKRVISFHCRVSGAKKFSEELTEVAALIEPLLLICAEKVANTIDFLLASTKITPNAAPLKDLALGLKTR